MHACMHAVDHAGSLKPPPALRRPSAPASSARISISHCPNPPGASESVRPSCLWYRACGKPHKQAQLSDSLEQLAQASRNQGSALVAVTAHHGDSPTSGCRLLAACARNPGALPRLHLLRLAHAPPSSAGGGDLQQQQSRQARQQQVRRRRRRCRRRCRLHRFLLTFVLCLSTLSAQLQQHRFGTCAGVLWHQLRRCVVRPNGPRAAGGSSGGAAWRQRPRWKKICGRSPTASSGTTQSGGC